MQQPNALECPYIAFDQANKIGKYVNMADIISHRDIDETEALALVELLFFAYRDFVADADELLEDLGFGRAHHRILHFVGRDPGMTVAQLLEILKITKQSLSRVLKDLIDQNYIFQKEGTEDRRQRLLYLSPAGNELWQRLSAPQIKRFQQAIRQSRMEERPHYREMLYDLINPGNRIEIRDWIDRVSVIGEKQQDG
jgi:DNA-binding MarR family transcriptional regulator